MGITDRIRRELERIAPGAVLPDEPMARHTSFGLGGPADLYVEPPHRESLRDALCLLRSERVPTLVLGRGTNLLVRDGGIEGVVVGTASALDSIDVGGNGLTVGGGVPLPRVLRHAAREGLAGLEELSGIPGSAGGAIAMNAGSFGLAIGDRVERVELFSEGTPSLLEAGALGFSYRGSGIPEGAVVERVRLRLASGDPSDIEARGREFMERKWRTQPSGMRSAGCIFRNPPDDAAGRLIDEAGLKGLRVGGAVVSDLHANYIVNDRGASAADVEELIETVRRLVGERAGVSLELEVGVIGRPLPTGGRSL
ncbi:MAG: UDP-N-acetylmuramate dehydrogenase [Candidatus Eisenbacteria bacterium]|nr:UDP-N-acetylmuramate dehydrogenase [Candidatus Eisenbacteria bacterium]